MYNSQGRAPRLPGLSHTAQALTLTRLRHSAARIPRSATPRPQLRPSRGSDSARQMAASFYQQGGHQVASCALASAKLRASISSVCLSRDLLCQTSMSYDLSCCSEALFLCADPQNHSERLRFARPAAFRSAYPAVCRSITPCL